jgi:hypothetical protein
MLSTAAFVKSLKGICPLDVLDSLAQFVAYLPTCTQEFLFIACCCGRI